jgi:hypothetical protein
MTALGAGVHSGGSRQALRAFCGAEETRTPDFLLAKEALYQLSYGPVSGSAANGAAAPSIASVSERIEWCRHGPIRRSRIQAYRLRTDRVADTKGMSESAHARVGASGLEPETSALSGQCSNQLS